MKYFFLILVLFAGRAQAQKLIVAEDCEVVPPNSQMDWSHSKTGSFNAWTSGSQNPDAQLSTHTLKAVTVGSFGAPAPLRGTKSYQMKMDYIGYGIGLQYARNELHFGNNCNDYTQTRWAQVGVYLPSSGFYGADPSPTQICFDAKFGDSQGPASFSLWVQNGKYVVQQKANHNSNETQTILSGNVDYNIWVSWIVDRNFKDDATGYIKLYKMRHGVDAAKVLVYSHTGPNYLMACGSNSEPYYQIGLYKWSWDKPPGDNAGYPYDAAGRVSFTMYLDNIKFWRTSATDADIDADLAGDEGPPGNQQPIVDAGPNQTITLPTTTANLNSTASDPDGTIATYLWAKTSGPGGGTISNTALEDPALSSLNEGTYVYQVTVTDNQGAQAVDYVTITVLPSTPPPTDNPFPTNAGNVATPTPDFTVQLPTTDTTLFLYADDTDPGYASPLHVFKISGPAGGTVTEIEQANDNPTTFEVNFSALQEGTYVYRFEITDSDDGITVNDTFNIIVVSAANDVPLVNAGSDQTHPLDGFGPFQTKNTTLNGTTSDPDGTIASVGWIVLSGPENSAFGSPTNDTTTFDGLLPGTYVVRLIATDNNGATAFDDITIRILSVNAGSDQTVALPTSTVTLTAVSNSVSDTTDVLWTKISGTGGTITQSGQLSTTVTGLTAGTYVYQITVTHTGGYIVKDQITVTILNANYYRIKRLTP